MSDDTKLDLENSDKSLEGKPEQSRRRFAKTGLAGGAVLMTLLSRPASAWNNNDPRCTGSILASIDAGSSLHDFEPKECRFGCDPWFWCERAPREAWRKAGVWPRASFNAIFTCYGHDGREIGLKHDPSIRDVCRGDIRERGAVARAAKQAMAAWLNARVMGHYFGIRADDIVDEYCRAFKKWKYENKDWKLKKLANDLERVNGRNCPLYDPHSFFYD